MKLESVVFGIAGAFFGLIAGWIIGSQQASLSQRSAAPASQSAPPQSATPQSATPQAAETPAVLDEKQVRALQTEAERDPKNAAARAQLGNLYYDAGRYTDAIKWYGESVALNPRDVNVSTDLG